MYCLRHQMRMNFRCAQIPDADKFQMRTNSRCAWIQSQDEEENDTDDDDNNDGLFFVSADNMSIIC